MDNFSLIQEKLHGFIRKYYTNELIKGLILFLAFGLLYLLFTLFIEHFLWLKPTARTILFWIFIFVEFSLLLNYIAIPIFRLIGFSKGISLSEASRIIGKHFNNIDDKLLNMIQLHESNLTSEFGRSTELTLASIDQKAAELQPIPFKKAIRFSKNKKYFKYLFIPIGIWLVTLLVGRNTIFTSSYDRILHHQQAFIPPAPFSFYVTNESLQVIEGSAIQINIQTKGSLVPEEAKIVFANEDYFLSNHGGGKFSYSFDQIITPIKFSLIANTIESQPYKISMIPTPKIQAISMHINYPKYVKKSDETITNTGSCIVPTGTQITWNIQTQQTDSLDFVSNQNYTSFTKNESKSNGFKLSKTIRKSFTYSIKASNQSLKDYEKLSFSIEVIQDEYPSLHIETDIDSISHGKAQFIGHLSDDYGLSKLELVYYTKRQPKEKYSHDILIQQDFFSDFYYVFPKELPLIEGIDYEFYFEVFDNDAVAGSKSIKSRVFSYHKNTDLELEGKLLQEQKEGLDELNKTLQKQEKNRLDLEQLQQELQNKPNLEFNDTKKLNKFLNRQKEYQEMMQRQTDELERNLNEQPELNNPDLQLKKEDLQKRLQEAKNLKKQNKLLEELQKMAEKLQKLDMLDRIKKMSKNSKQNEKSLEQLLELTKRFYVEQKAEQIREKLEELANKQEELSKSDKNDKEKQDTLNKEFEEIQKEMDDLQKENNALKEPMDIENQEQEQKSIEEDMQNASEELDENNKTEANKKQQSAANKMKQMAQKMKMQMAAMQGEMIEEDIALLRTIIENLITFSYKQEALMLSLADMHPKHPNFAQKMKEQNMLKNYFEHIDDSLYTLALRQVKLSPKINEFVSNANYYLLESLVHYTDNQMYKANSDQQYVMTASNDLAVLLSRLLDNMQSSKMGMGKGKGKGKGKGDGKSFSLPDIIQKQGKMIDEIKKGMKEGGKKPGDKEGEGQEGSKGEKGKNKGDSGGNQGKGNQGENDSQELYEIFKQQALLRQALESQLNDLQGKGPKSNADNVIKQMEELEKMLLDKGITNEVLNRMLRVEHELLKLKEASQQQGQEEKRESNTNIGLLPKQTPKQLQFKNKYLKQDEILNRNLLPLRSQYKQKVKHYFKLD